MTSNVPDELPDDGKAAKAMRGALQVVGGVVPVVGGILSAIAGAWSEREQAKVNQFFGQWVHMLEEEIREKEATVIEIMARLDLQDEKVSARLKVESFSHWSKKHFVTGRGLKVKINAFSYEMFLATRQLPLFLVMMSSACLLIGLVYIQSYILRLSAQSITRMG